LTHTHDKQPRVRLSAQNRRQQILSTSAHLIAQKGFKSVSVRDIAHSNGINEALIYHYFPTKENLFQEVMMEIREKSPGFAPGNISTEQDFWCGIEKFISLFQEVNQGEARSLRVILYAILEGYALPRDFDHQAPLSFFHWLSESLRHGQKDWNFPQEIDTEALFSFILGTLIYGEIQSSILHQNPGNLKPFLLNTLKMMLRTGEV